MTYINSRRIRETVGAIVDEYRKNQQENIGTLKPPKSLGQLGMFGVIVWVVILLIMIFGENDPPANIIEGVLLGIYWIFFALLLYLILYERNFRVIYKEGKITYRNTFRKISIYDCKDIVHTYYKNNGGIQFVFRNGKKLNFDEQETFFCYLIIVKEHLNGEFKDGFPQVIKVYVYPIYMIIFWSIEIAVLIWAYIESEACLYFVAICWVLICLELQTNRATYDRDKQILTCKKYGFTKNYDMRYYHAKPVYEYQLLRKVKIYDDKKTVTEISVSPMHKNQIKMIYALCNEDV